MTISETLRMSIESWLGTEYRWGGDDPDGIDCSGLVQELLWSVGALPYKSDKTADGLYRLCEKDFTLSAECPYGLDGSGLGVIAFYRGSRGDRITHCELVVCKSPKVLSIGARGGKHIEGYVKIRPTCQRSNMIFVAFGDLFDVIKGGNNGN